MKRGKALCLLSQKIQKIPLWHYRQQTAMRSQMSEIRDGDFVAANPAAQFANLLVRPLEKLVEQAQLVHHLQRGRMDGVAAEISQKVGVLFQHDHIDAR